MAAVPLDEFLKDNGNGANGAAREDVFRENGDYGDAADEIEAKLRRRGALLYESGGILVQPVQRNGTLVLAPVTVSLMRYEMSRHLRFSKLDKRRKAASQKVYIDPAEDTARLLLDRAALPHIVGVIHAQTLSPGMAVIDREGYDAETGLYFAGLSDMEPINREQLTREDALDALNVLKSPLAEFPFANDESRSVGLSGLMVSVLPALVQQVPIHAISAPAPGSGKTYLVRLAANLATGRDCSVLAASSKPEEFEKQLTACLLSGARFTCIDNVSSTLTSDLLCQAVEQPKVKVRPLGTSSTAEADGGGVWFVTGNGLVIAADVKRRAIYADLDANEERPELHVFADDPIAMVRLERGIYVRAVLTIVLAYVAARMPERLPPLASFGAWSDYVRSALVWLGEADPCKTMVHIRENDTELTEAEALFSVWPESDAFDDGHTVHQLIGLSLSNTMGAWREALETVARSREGGISSWRLGNFLRVNKNRVVTVFADGAPRQVKLTGRKVHAGYVAWKLHDLGRA